MNKGPKHDKGNRMKNAKKVVSGGLHKVSPTASSTVPKIGSTSASTLNPYASSVTQEPKSGLDGSDKSGAPAPVIAPSWNQALVPTTNSSTTMEDNDKSSSIATSTTEKSTSEQSPSVSYNDPPASSTATPGNSDNTSAPVVAPISSSPMVARVDSQSEMTERPSSTPTLFPSETISRSPTTSPTTSPSAYPTSDPIEKPVAMPSRSPDPEKGNSEPEIGRPINSSRTPSPKTTPTLAPVMDPIKASGVEGSPIASPSEASPIETKSPEVESTTTIAPTNTGKTMVPSSTTGSKLDNTTGEGITISPTDTPTEAPILPEITPSSSPEVQGFTKAMQTSPLIVQFSGSFDLAAVRDEIIAIVETELNPYLVLAIGSILQDFNLSMSFKSDDASLADEGHRRQESTTDSVFSEVSVLLHLFGMDLGELNSLDDFAASEILRSFFVGISANHLLQALLSAGIDIVSVEVSSLIIAEAESEPSNKDASGKRRENTTRTALLACMFSGSIVFAALATAVIHSRRRHRKKFSLEQQLAETIKDVRSNTREHKTQALSDGSVSSCDDSMSSYNTKDRQDSPVKSCKVSPHLDSAILTMMDGPDLLVVTTANMRCLTPSETESIFTTDEQPSDLPTEVDATVTRRKKGWRPWNRKSSKDTEVNKQDPERMWFERVEIDGVMKNVYLSPIDL